MQVALKIVRVDGLIFAGPVGRTVCRGFAFKSGDGYLSFNGETPYTPVGGKRALQSILDLGGFEGYDGITFVMPFDAADLEAGITELFDEPQKIRRQDQLE